MKALVFTLALLLPAVSAWADGDPPLDEDKLFGKDSGVEDLTKEGAKDKSPGKVLPKERPFTVGGTAYLRFQGFSLWADKLEEHRFSMPNLLDVYLDARPDPRVRAFASGRLVFNPAIAEGDVDALGQPLDRSKVLLNQLWIKTDIARVVFITAGAQRIKWGASRIWNPTDFLNATHRNPLSFFDERTGVTLLKLHVPIEKLGWNIYGVAFFDGVDRLEEVGGALRLEMAYKTTEISLSAMAGKGRKTSLGLDISAGVGPFDLYAEAALVDETGSVHYEGEYDLSDPGNPVLPTTRTLSKYYGRISAGFMATFKTSATDYMVLGAEYFYNPLGYSNRSLYPFLIAQGAFEPLYLGTHNVGLFWLIPSPGKLDDLTLTTSTVANFSDMSFITRLDASLRVHRMLRLEVFAMFGYGSLGGNAALLSTMSDPEADIEDIDPNVAPMLFTFGVHLRVAM
jgi:hypothetical protein